MRLPAFTGWAVAINVRWDSGCRRAMRVVKGVARNFQGDVAEIYLHGAHVTSWKTAEGEVFAQHTHVLVSGAVTATGS